MTTPRYFLVTFLMIALGALVACSGKKTEETHDHEHHAGDSAATDDDWKAMDDFHMIMAESFHPYKDSANLAPAIAHAAELTAAANAWASAPLPEKVNTDEMKAKLQALGAQAAAFAETVKTNDQKAIGDGLTKLHDDFHAIQEMWYGGKGAHHH